MAGEQQETVDWEIDVSGSELADALADAIVNSAAFCSKLANSTLFCQALANSPAWKATQAGGSSLASGQPQAIAAQTIAQGLSR